MKEKASKSLGGASMCKFLEESERKRIMRLRNMKSAIAKSSYTRHENNWTRNNVERRHKEIKRDMKKSKLKSKDADGGDSPADFQLDNLCDVSEVRTKSGLKIKYQKQSKSRRVTNSAQKIRQREPRSDALKQDRDITYRKVNSNPIRSTRDEAEGKENCLPSNNATLMTKRPPIRQTEGKTVVGKTGVDSQKNMIEDRYDARSSQSSQKALKHHCRRRKKAEGMASYSERKNIDNVGETRSRRKGVVEGGGIKVKKIDRKVMGRKPDTRTSVKVGCVSDTRTLRPHVKRKPNGKKYTYDNRGVSLDTLSKEREEALQILEGLDKGRFASKLSGLKSSIDGLGKKTSKGGRVGTTIQVEDFDNLSLSSHRRVPVESPSIVVSDSISSSDGDVNNKVHNSMNKDSFADTSMNNHELQSSYREGVVIPLEDTLVGKDDVEYDERPTSQQHSISSPSCEGRRRSSLSNSTDTQHASKIEIASRTSQNNSPHVAEEGLEKSDSDMYSEIFESESSSFTTVGKESQDGKSISEYTCSDEDELHIQIKAIDEESKHTRRQSVECLGSSEYNDDDFHTKMNAFNDELDNRKSNDSVHEVTFASISFNDEKNEKGDMISSFHVESFFENLS